MEIKEISLDDIEVDKSQPRKSFEDIGELASNILKEGLIEPLKVIKNGKKYFLIDGERRFRALQLLKKSSGGYENIVRCIILNKPDYIKITQLCSDLHKRKLEPFEEAEAFKELIEGGLDISDLVSRLSKQRSYIVRRLKLTAFSPYTKKLIKDKVIPMSVVDKIDIDLFKSKEEDITNRIAKEKPRNTGEIKKIVDEETHRYEFRINSFLNTLDSFKREINSFDSYIRKEIEDARIEDARIEDARIENARIEIDRFLRNLNKFDKIRKDTEIIRDKLEKLFIKYGKDMTLRETKEQKGGLNSSQP